MYNLIVTKDSSRLEVKSPLTLPIKIPPITALHLKNT